MSEDPVTFQPFYIDRAKGGRAACKICKNKCLNGELRFAKIVPSPYGENQQMKSWHHVDCLMTALLKQRPTTKRIDSVNDIGNWHALSKEDQEFVLSKINQAEKEFEEKYSGKYKAKVLRNESEPVQNVIRDLSPEKNNIKSEDDKFSEFINLCKKIAKVDAYTDKTAIVNSFFHKGTDGEKFTGDLKLWCKLLLPQVTKRVYNLKSKQLVKLFSRIFHVDQDDMLEHLEKGDIAQTIQHFYSKHKTPAENSTLTIQDVENFLHELSKLTKEEEQISHFKTIVKKCTASDLKMIIRIIKGDLRINAGPKHILEGVHPDAYKVLQTSRDLDMVIERVSHPSGVKQKDSSQKAVQAKLALMTPVLPMLAEACKSVEMAMKKCPNGMFSEIKYDGERVQVHKKDREFKYFSRALKPVMPHKVNHFKHYLPQAFPEGEDLILDAEVLMIDINTGKPLPFGSLGIHKQSEFKDASVCLFVFDCLYYNGKVLLDVPIRKRREILLEHMKEVKNHVMLSEQEVIRKPADLANMIAKVLQLGLEGLVLKDLESTYEPGKRHWLKVKKDYLFDGAMADTADLVVLGAWFGTGKKGGMMSVFLMGCLDTYRNKWVTVTKVHTGHDDNTLEKLQKELEPLMLKISQDNTRIPDWLDCNKGLVPDFVAKDPKNQPVWEITGTEFTKANIHTADGISVRFPRVTRIRSDKDWKIATNLKELKHLYKTSKEKTDVTLLNKLAETASKDDIRSPTKIKASLKLNTVHKNNSNESTDLDSDEESKVKEERNKNTDKGIKRKMNSSNEISDKPSPKKVKEEPKSPKIKTVNKNNSNESTDLDSDEESKVKEERNKNTDKVIKRKMNSSNEISDTRSPKKVKEEPKSPKIKTVNKNNSNASTDLDSDEESKVKEERNKNTDKGVKRKMNSSNEISDKSSPRNQSNKIDSFFNKDKTPKKDSKHSTKDIKYKLVPDNPLPDIFTDLKLGFYPDFISFSEKERIDFERHWIAFGGKVVKALKFTNVDYVVFKDKKVQFEDAQNLRLRLGSKAKFVTKNWLIKCINERKLCDVTDYPVFIEPS